MSLLNKRLLQDTVSKHSHSTSPLTRQNVLDHLKTKVYDRIQQGSFRKEEAEKPAILPKLFELLGYSHPENYEFEFANQSRSADIILGVEIDGVRDVEVAVEWKGIDTKSLDKGKAGETPVSQMSDYMSKTNANFGMVSNFEKFRLYSKQKGQTEYYEISLEEIVTNAEKLEEFIFLFSKDNLLRNENKQSLLEILISQSEAEQEQITKRFYNDYKERRTNLFNHLIENNQDKNKHLLLEKSQKILDRLIFVMFCEDGFLLPTGILKSTYNLGKNSRSRSESKIWEEIQYLFEDINKGRIDVNPQINAFNGGLFAEDLELNNLIIKDSIWQDLIKLAEYDFASDLNVNILGHIFEQSISDIEEIKAELEGEKQVNNNVIDYLVNLIQEKAKNSKKPFIVALDGHGGSGKSTLAKKLNKLLPNSSILEMDDFYNQKSNSQHYDFDRLIQQVLEPIVNNHQNILFQKTVWGAGDWSKNTTSNEYFPLEAKDFLIIEGLLSTDEKLSSYLNLKIKTQCQVELSHQRGIKRDIEEYGLEPNTVREQWQKWSKQHTTKDLSQEDSVDIIINTENQYKIVKNRLEGNAKPKTSKRKKDGIYYTPEYITNYIVSETIGSWLNQESNQLEQIKVLDPAGGSGAFPNQVHNYLAKRHAEMVNQEAKEAGFEGGLAELDEKQIDKSILKNNIFMVDLQPESVEIAKLSLWLKTAKKDQKLNNLDENIKCGNSLINDTELSGDKAFDWNTEFPEVMASGGFDVVVGNPPWVDIKNLEPKLVKILFEKYKTAKNRINLYAIFIEKGLSLLKNNGYLGFIIPSSLLMNESYHDLRKLILKDFDVKLIVKLPDNVFEDVKMETMIIILKKGKSIDNKVAVKIYDRNQSISKVEAGETLIEQKTWEKDGYFNIYISNNDLNFIQKLEKIENHLSDCCDFSLGITPYDKYTGQDPELIKSRGYHSTVKIDETYKPLIDGGDVDRYIITPSNKEYIKYGEWLGAMREERFFVEPHIVVRQIVNQRIFAGYTESHLYNTQIGFNLVTKDGWNLKYILAVLNSEILNEYHTKKFLDQTKNLFQKILIVNAKQLPIPKATTEQQTQIAEQVDQIIAFKTNSQTLTNSFLKLITAKYKPTTISTKLKNWYKLDIAGFLDELKKQKAVIGGLSAESELMAYFDEQKGKVLDLEKEAERVDGEIEELVRGLYGVN